MRLQVNEELSQVLCSRANTRKSKEIQWCSDHPWFRKKARTWDEEKDEPYFRGYGRTATGPRLWTEIRNSLGSGSYEKDSVWADKTQASSEAWLRSSLFQELKGVTISQLLEKRARLSEETKKELENANWGLIELAEAKSTDDLYWFVEELNYALERKGSGLENDDHSRRFTREEARSSVECLEDVKAVIDFLLFEGARTRERWDRPHGIRHFKYPFIAGALRVGYSGTPEEHERKRLERAWRRTIEKVSYRGAEYWIPEEGVGKPEEKKPEDKKREESKLYKGKEKYKHG
jgi:hypothetical protein